MSNISVTNYVINNKKNNKKILVLSDIHYWSKKNANKLEKIKNYIKDKKYDFICIPGDFINDGNVKDHDILVAFFEYLSKNAKVIISLGNHDTMIFKKRRIYYKNEKLFERIENINNVFVLDNEFKEIGNIRFIGVSLPNDYYEFRENHNYFYRYLNNIYDKLPKNLYNIILCHSPACIHEEIIKNIPLFDNANLIITGHLHAGLIPHFIRKRLKGRGLVTPHKGFFPKRCYGLYDVGDKKLVISPGVTKFDDHTLFRIFEPLYNIDLVSIELRK